MDNLCVFVNDEGGKVISKEYNEEKMIFQCKFGHQWEDKPINIYMGMWCKTCFGTVKYEKW